MQTPSLTKDQILQDIEIIYQRALACEKWSMALRAKEMQAKIMGLFRHQRLPDTVRIADMSQDQLAEFIARLEANEPELKNLNPLKPDTDQNNASGLADPKPPEPEALKKDNTMSPIQDRPRQDYDMEFPPKQTVKQVDEEHPPP